MSGQDVFNTVSFGIFVLLFKQDLQNDSAQSHDRLLETEVTVLEQLGLPLPFRINIIQLLSTNRSAIVTERKKTRY